MNAINNDAAKPNDLPEKILHYINGEFVESIDGEEFDVLDPVTNKTYITAASGKPQDVDKAVAAAKEAFENGSWANALPRERARVLNKIADVVETRAEKLAAWESFDSGLPITQATARLNAQQKTSAFSQTSSLRRQMMRIRYRAVRLTTSTANPSALLV